MNFPAHASPAYTPIASPRPERRERAVSELQLNPNADSIEIPPLVSPRYTPPQTPSAGGQNHERSKENITAGSEEENELTRETSRRLLEKLPEVTCEVRARIPTTTGTEMWLHLYHNDVDGKEHLAIVFGPHIRSRSLDAPRPGETERDRMIRGAYVGTLYPGRTSSRLEQIRRDAGVPSSRASADYLSQLSGYSPKSKETSMSRSSSQVSEMSSASDTESNYPPELGPPLVRIHSECYTGETVWSARCDCGEQLDEAARLMSLPASTPATPGSESSQPISGEQFTSSGGVIIYLRQEGRGIGLLSKLKAYNLQDLGHDTMEANLLLRHPGDARSYGLATAMLVDLGLGGERGIRLLTNNPEKVRAVEGMNHEVRVVERVPMIPLAWKTGGKEGVSGPEVEKYISTKIEKFKHMFSG